eukprot:6214509-Pleurochrysis_carterae.AAC.7
MPRMTCWCDRYWWLLENCRFPGVSAEAHPMPFHCPFDHLYDLEKWVHSDVPMREYSFLENPRVRAEDRLDVVRVRVEGARREDSSTSHERSVVLPAGANYKAVADEVVARGWQDAFVVQVHARSLELLCEDLGSAEENGQFNKIMHTVLGVAEQVASTAHQSSLRPIPICAPRSTGRLCVRPNDSTLSLFCAVPSAPCMRSC